MRVEKWLNHGRLARWHKWRACDMAEAELILQPFCHFTYVTTHSPTLPSLYLHHSSFSNPSVASPTSQLILQPFFHFSYITGSSLTSPGEPPMGWMKYVGRETGRNPKENLLRPTFIHHRTHMEWLRCELGTPAVGGERLTACTTRLPGI